MPVYKEISNEILNMWFTNIVNQILKLRRDLNKDSLYLLIVRLYEYIQCKVKFESSGVEFQEDVRVTYSDIKKCTLWSKYSSVLNKLYNLRNAICHTNDSSYLKRITALVNSAEFCPLLRELGFEDYAGSYFKEICDSLQNYDSLVDSCSRRCRLMVQRLRKSSGTVEDLLSSLYSEYPRKVVDACVLGTLSSEQFA